MPASQRDDTAGLPERLKTLRKQKDLSQQELAERAGVHYTHIGRYERGQSKPTTETLRGLAEALGVSLDYLVDGATDDVARATFEDRDLLRQFQELQTLDEDDKRVIKTLIDAFLAKRKIQELMAS